MLNLEAKHLLEELNFCIIDLETTGGNHKYDKIIEIGIARVEKLKLTDKKNFLINPEIPIPEFIQKLTSIKQEDIKDSPKIEEVIDEVLEFIGDSILVAHNTSFDIPFLNSVLKRLKYPYLTNRVLCTNVMTKYLIPEMMNSNLSHMCNIFEIEHTQAHRAISDATSTAHLLLKYLDIFIQKNLRKVNQLYYPRNKFELDRIHFKKRDNREFIFSKLSLLKSPFTIIEKGQQGIILNCSPIESFQSDQEWVKSIVFDKKWDLLTIKLNSHFLESLMIYKDMYLKIVSEQKDTTIENLSKKSFYQQDLDTSNSVVTKFFDSFHFIISQHIIPEQYTIVANYSFSLKQSLIFKYPSHKKKLEHYINSQSNRLKTCNKNLKRIFNSEEVIKLFYYYLNSIHQDPNFLFIKKSDLSSTLKKFNHLTKEYTKTYKNKYNFPIVHL
jgi:DNA polymerase-3 subunit alpha (Gram-positive type)